MTPGIYTDIPNDKYHADEGLSRSDLVNILRSPAHYKYPPEEEKETPALLFGEAFHLRVLQPDLFEQRYACLPPDYDGRTAKGKALKAEAEASGKQILKYEDMETIKGMSKSLRKHPEISRILESGLPEVSCYWYDPRYPGILLKCRIDWLNMMESIILDLKSALDARPEFFTSSAYKHGYDVQCGFYLSGISTITKAEHRRFLFAAVEKEKPYGVMLYEASQEFINEGMKKAQIALAIYDKCRQEDSWPAYPQETQSLNLPLWLRKKESGVIYE